MRCVSEPFFALPLLYAVLRGASPRRSIANPRAAFPSLIQARAGSKAQSPTGLVMRHVFVCSPLSVSVRAPAYPLQRAVFPVGRYGLAEAPIHSAGDLIQHPLAVCFSPCYCRFVDSHPLHGGTPFLLVYAPCADFWLCAMLKPWLMPCQ